MAETNLQDSVVFMYLSVHWALGKLIAICNKMTKHCTVLCFFIFMDYIFDHDCNDVKGNVSLNIVNVTLNRPILLIANSILNLRNFVCVNVCVHVCYFFMLNQKLREFAWIWNGNSFYVIQKNIKIFKDLVLEFVI